MAEYIDRAELSVTPIDITDLPTDKCLMVYLAEDVDSLPTADVIERSKVNKAIEDINTEMSYGSARFMQETMYHKGLKRALEILKRNIGE